MSVNQNDVNEGRINDQLGSQLESFSAQLEANLERGRNALAEWRTRFPEKSSEFTKTMDRYTHEHPWRMISSALVAGLVLGFAIGCQTASRSARS